MVNNSDVLTDIEYEDDHSPRSHIAVRPIGVWILAILFVLGGVMIAAVSFLALSPAANVERVYRAFHLTPEIIFAGAFLAGVVVFATGVGMFVGWRWGWWLATLYFVWTAFRSSAFVINLMLSPDLTDVIGESTTRGMQYYLVKYGMRVPVNFLLTVYMFRENVLGFFGLSQLAKLKAVVILAGVSLAMVVIPSVIANFILQQ